MNPIAKEMEDILKHEGVSILDGSPGRGSGRYPLGSGENPYQHSIDFYTRCRELDKSGLSEVEIAKSMGFKSTTEYRKAYTIAKDNMKNSIHEQVLILKNRGYSNIRIAKELGLKGESTVRSILNERAAARRNVAKNTADFLKKMVDEKGMLDVGAGVERELGDISRVKLNEALKILEEQGYPTYGIGLPQVTNPGRQTPLKVLCPPGTKHSEVYNFENIHTVVDYATHDGGETFDSMKYPASLDSKRLKIRYAEDGGIDKDGVIELRRGVPDLDLGKARYAQVRMLVDGTHYLKGMALYSDDMPDGVDVVFNTNKTKDKSKMEVLKEISTTDPKNPFGALIKANGQSYYIDENGEKKLSIINKTREEGDWDDWSQSLSAQFLSKQSKELITKQLDLAKINKKVEFEEILNLTNPAVKQHFLNSFAEDCDTAAVHLDAASLPRQRYQVILPLTNIKDTEAFAPNYKNGERIALIRYPHGGTFEIPILTVNNRNTEGTKVIGKDALDAIGINKKVADRLSGADFDGDTVMVIPTGGRINIISTPPLKELEGFDPKMSYPERKGMKYMTKAHTQKQMGLVSNLIQDMTIKGAGLDELARAVKHSMVVIDAYKHKLDYKLSEKENGIAELKEKYQEHVKENGKISTGASTLITRAGGELDVLKRRGQPWINTETGELEWERINPKTGEFESKIEYREYTDKKGKKHVVTQKSTQMAETKDARTLSTGTVVEEYYADYANSMKALANQARKEMLATPNQRVDPAAKKTYKKEVDSLLAKLSIAEKNAPRERAAQTMANVKIKAITSDNPELTQRDHKKELKKIRQRVTVESRAIVGAKRTEIKISDKEWEAIQAGAVTHNTLRKILLKADADDLRERSMPRTKTTLSEAKISKIKAMNKSGHSNAEIAEAIGCSTSTVLKYLK